MVKVNIPVSETYVAFVGVNGPPVPVTAPGSALMKVCAYAGSVIPIAIVDGLPIGAEFCANYFNENNIFSFSKFIEDKFT